MEILSNRVSETLIITPQHIAGALLYIYTMSDPVSGLVRYVGKTKNPKQRFRKHLTSKKLNTKSCRWIKGLKAKGLKPVFEIVDTCTESDWQQKERQYILVFKSIGAGLLNQLPGGEGGATMLGKKLTEEQKAKISKSKLGKSRPASLGVIIRNKKAIVQYDLNGNLIAEHDSIREAARSINRSQRRIQMMVNNVGKKVNHVGGYIFSLK